jgi:hypothetical protein
MTTFSELRQATLRARERTDDSCVGVTVTMGKFNIVRAIPPKSGKGSYTIDFQSADLSLPQAIEFLNSYRYQS